MKVVRIFLILVFTLILWLAVRQYLFCPQFTFVKGKPFSGNQLYNPYASIDSGEWVKCNFHAHTHAWKGLTNGRGTANNVWRCYDSLGYGVHSVSDYHKINDAFSDKENYIPAYEHGYNMTKTHQLVLGDKQVKWLDYIFPQTLSNKQYILNQLSEDAGNVVILNHPSVRNGFTEDDLRYLSNYDCVEVLNPWAFSFKHWDAALSAGKPVFIVGDDDSHDVSLSSIGKCCTRVNVSKVSCKNVLSALKKGESYGMRIAKIPGELIEERIQRLKYELPGLKKFTVAGDTIQLAITKMAKQIQIIGQNGKILQVSDAVSNVVYVMQQQDNYIRAAITFEDGTEIFLNPVFRYSGTSVLEKAGPLINSDKTLLFFVSGLIIFSAWCAYVITFLFGKLLWKHRREESLQESPLPTLG